MLTGGSNNDAKTSSSAGKPNFSNLTPISLENLQDVEMISSPDDSGIVAGKRTSINDVYWFLAFCDIFEI